MKHHTYKSAYRDAVKAHGLKVPFLAKLHRKAESTIEKWIYEKRGSPQFSDIFELWAFFRAQKIDTPRGINTVYSRHYQRGWLKGKQRLENKKC